MVTGEIIIPSGRLECVKERDIKNVVVLVLHNVTCVNQYSKEGVCEYTDRQEHQPEKITGDHLELRNSSNFRGHSMLNDEFEMAESGYGDYCEFAVYEFIDGEYFLNPQKVLEVWYAYDYDKYFGRLNINIRK